MTKYLKLLTVALFATMSFALTSCGGDEPDDPNGGEKDVQYTFKFNNKTYYYGYDVDYGIITLHQMGGFSLEKDYCFLAFEAQDVPIKTDENDWGGISNWKTDIDDYGTKEESGSANKFFFNVGVGGQYDLNDKLAVNLEIKYQYIKNFNRLPISLGVAYKF